MSCYKIEVYVPATESETVKDAMFEAGAGKIGNYDRCCWETAGAGQFRPLPGSNPYLGSEGETEQVNELKLELLCPEERLAAVIAAMRSAHPYETPAFHYFKINTE